MGQPYFILGPKHVISLSAHQDLGAQTQEICIFGFFQDDSGEWSEE